VLQRRLPGSPRAVVLSMSDGCRSSTASGMYNRDWKAEPALAHESRGDHHLRIPAGTEVVP